MASESLSDKGEIRVDVVFNGLRDAQKALDDFSGTDKEAAGAVDRLQDALDLLDKEFRKGAKGGVTKMSSELKDLQAQLKKAQDEFRQLAVQARAEGSTTPSADAGVSFGLTPGRAKQIIADQAAVSASVVGESKKIVAAEASALKQRADEDRMYNDYLSHQRDGIAKKEAAALKQQNEMRDAVAASFARNEKRRRDDDIRDRSLQAKAIEDNTRRQIESQQRHEQSIISTRYALYDVATTAGIASVALLGLATATVAVAASFESSFTDVERTTLASGAALEQLKAQLTGLTREIPLAFSEITDIASLGAQLGIASTDLESFTKTVAQFAATTNVSTESAGTAFGALGELLDVSASDYNRLGSAIAYVGVNSVATESEILSMATRLAASAANAGYSAQQVVALSGALASLRVAPERAQGVMEVYFNRLNTAIASGGEQLNAFAHYAGVSTGEVEALVKTDPVGFFRRLAEGLGGLDTTQTTQALEQLGLQGIRAGEVFTRVANNVEVFDQALADSTSAYADGTFLAQVYGMRVDDLASKFQMLINGIQELATAAGSALIPILGPVIDGLTDVLNFFTDILSTDAGKWFAGVSIGAAALVGALLAVVSAAALSTASLFALRSAVMGLGWQNATGGVAAFIATLFGVKAAGDGATMSMRGFKIALASTGIGLAVVALGALATAFWQASQDSKMAFADFVGSTGGLSDAIAADTAAWQAAFDSGNLNLANSYTTVKIAAEENTEAVDENARVVAGAATILGIDAPNALGDSTSALRDNSAALGDNTIAWLKNQLIQSDAFLEIAKNADFTEFWAQTGGDFDQLVRIAAVEGEAGIQAYFQTLMAAYTKGNQALLDASLMGNPGGPLQQITGGLTALKDGLSGFQGQIQLLGLQNAITGNNGVMATGEGIADNYASSLRDVGSSGGGAAREIRTLVDYANDLRTVWDRAFEIRFSGQQGMDTITSGWRKIQQAIADATAEVAEHSAKLQGLASDRAVKEYWLSVAENYGDALRAAELRAELADIDVESTKTQKSLSKAQDKTNKTLEGNSDAAIANRAEILGLVQDYQSYIGALAQSGMEQGELAAATAQAKADFIAQATQLGYNSAELGRYALAFDDVSTAIGRVPRNVTVTANVDPALQALNEYEARLRSIGSGSYGGGTVIPPNTYPAADIAEAMGKIEYYRSMMQWAADNRNWTASSNAEVGMVQWRNRLASLRGYATGGYVGDGGRLEPKGIVHGGEFVFTKQATKNLGMGNLARLMSVGERGAGYAGGGAVGAGASGAGFVSLSPFDRQLLMRIEAAAGVTIDSAPIGNSVMAQNTNASQRRNA